MKNTSEKVLLNEAVAKMADDMESREIGAIIWNVGQAGFHFIPEIVVNPKDGSRPVRVTGLYRYDGRLYAIEEDVAEIHPKDFYTPDVDVPPRCGDSQREEGRGGSRRSDRTPRLHNRRHRGGMDGDSRLLLRGACRRIIEKTEGEGDGPGFHYERYTFTFS